MRIVFSPLASLIFAVSIAKAISSNPNVEAISQTPTFAATLTVSGKSSTPTSKTTSATPSIFPVAVQSTRSTVQPTSQSPYPSICSTWQPTTTKESIAPTYRPSLQAFATPPTLFPSARSTTLVPHGTIIPSISPTSNPTSRKPSTATTLLPSISSSSQPTAKPSLLPTRSPTTIPSTLFPSSKPTACNTIIPSKSPTSNPTSRKPTTTPTLLPSTLPSSKPTAEQSQLPTGSPSTLLPSAGPTAYSTIIPSTLPTTNPTSFNPTTIPTLLPSESPSSKPTAERSQLPTGPPSALLPSAEPTVDSSIAPTISPTTNPTSFYPTIIPTLLPSESPSSEPTAEQSQLPTGPPSTFLPSAEPTADSTVFPSISPTTNPTSFYPTTTPTLLPSTSPSSEPTAAQSLLPTVVPSAQTCGPPTPWIPAVDASQVTAYPVVTGISLTLDSEIALAVDGYSSQYGYSIFYADTNNHRIGRYINGGLQVVAGNGSPGYAGDNGPASNAKLNAPTGLFVSKNGDLYISDTGNSRIRMISYKTMIITTVAGTGTPGYNGDGILAIKAQINNPLGLFVRSNGDVYFADSGNLRIRVISYQTGLISTVVGTGNFGFNGDGLAPSQTIVRRLNSVTIAKNSGDIYFTDGNGVRKVSSVTGNLIVTTVIGGYFGYLNDLQNIVAPMARIVNPRGLAVTNNTLYIGTYNDNLIRTVDLSTTVINSILTYEFNPAKLVLSPAGTIYFVDFGFGIYSSSTTFL